MATTIRGDRLFRLDMALAALVEDPGLLDRARRRFSETPSYRTHYSHNSTLSQSSNPPSEEQQRREKRKWKLILEHRASFPVGQFDAQRHEEYRRLFKPAPGSGCIFSDLHMELARATVKKQWVEQGIWNEEWGWQPSGRWKHEEPLQPESDNEIDSEAKVRAPLFCLSPSPTRAAEPRRPKSAEELQQIAEQRAVQEREREPSRPFYQFIYQVSNERKRIQDEMNPPDALVQNESNTQGATIPTPLDINTTAYERMKNTWMKRGIWNRKWGVLPGMSWKHEQSLEEMLLEGMGNDTPVQANRLEADRHETGEAPARSIFGCLLSAESNHEASDIFEASDMLNESQKETPAASILGVPGNDGHGAEGASPRWNIFGSLSPAESSHGPVSGCLNASPQEPPPAADPAGLPNGDPNHSSAASNSRRRHAESRETPRSAPPQRRRRGKREPSIEGGQALQIARTALGPAHSSKVYKARGKSGPGPRRRPNASKLPSEAQQSLPGLHVPTAPPKDTPVLPRRSRRLEEARHKAAADLAGVATADPHDGGSQSRPRRISAGPKPAGSAKPQGVSKRRPNTTRPRAR
ncbi:hypothetical protein QBC33DRAFT_523809 [Phialemonium atrogriseum]|uniref:Uncharacterized protein n=1 Tax=Phialemonium atrogriseum TaxID=1093897 RepID=A0AAJ0CBZ4_9PEZI|nr:uncharacterized protein QBC33DRAFT_523809 [Phialemonium atrogriseum]KAK1771471.1 hypothetical protein QBC33DRAFT_523809 [Phialemonium atrogriseum]